MANELQHASDSANTLYAHIYRVSDKAIYSTTNSVFEAIGTWNDARAQATDLAMTAVGDSHWADFPAVAEGVYFVIVKLQATGSPLASDKETAQGWIYWDGAQEINMLTEIKSWAKNG